MFKRPKYMHMYRHVCVYTYVVCVYVYVCVYVRMHTLSMHIQNYVRCHLFQKYLLTKYQEFISKI